MAHNHKLYTCQICSNSFRAREVLQGHLIRLDILKKIQSDDPKFTYDSFICQEDLAKYRANYVHSLLESEKGELSNLEKEVLASLQRQEVISTNVDQQFQSSWKFSDRLADGLASFGGSWAFIILFAVFLLFWIMMNSLVLFWRPVDPYPFILLNLLLSCIAAIQAPVIMMSQNRQEEKDRIRAQHDYKVNLKAELEIQHLHEKLDHLLSKQWERLAEMQEIQLEVLSELKPKK